MKWTYIMDKQHWEVSRILKKFFNLRLNRGEIYTTQSMMYNERFIVIIKFTGSRFNYSLIDFSKQKIVMSCVSWVEFFDTLKNTSVR